MTLQSRIAKLERAVEELPQIEESATDREAFAGVIERMIHNAGEILKTMAGHHIAMIVRDLDNLIAWEDSQPESEDSPEYKRWSYGYPSDGTVSRVLIEMVRLSVWGLYCGPLALPPEVAARYLELYDEKTNRIHGLPETECEDCGYPHPQPEITFVGGTYNGMRWGAGQGRYVREIAACSLCGGRIEPHAYTDKQGIPNVYRCAERYEWALKKTGVEMFASYEVRSILADLHRKYPGYLFPQLTESEEAVH